MAVTSQAPKIFGVLLRFGHPLTGTGRIRLVSDWFSQFVDHVLASMGVPRGSPVFQRRMFENCHPPMNASSSPLSLAAKVRPRPNGSCQMELTLIMWRVSKSDAA